MNTLRLDARIPTLVALLAAGWLAAGCASNGDGDPLQPTNRAIFGFNEGVDRYAVEPVARGWDWVMPEIVQDGFSNFFDNLSMPVIFLNDLLQAKPLAAGQDLGRFVVNTTVGVVGFVDVASRLGIPQNDEDFGQTLGRWGTPAGPYLVLPLLGPSNPRDTVGLVVDAVTTPWQYFVPWEATAAARGTSIVNFRADVLEEVEENRRTAVDYYVFVRNAFVQHRERRVRDEAEEPPESEEDLYYPEDEAVE